MKNITKLHYRPASGLFGDPMPFYWDGIYHIYFQNSPGELSFDHMHWSHISSTDMISWQNHPDALVPDAAGPDAYGCWTGSVIRAGDLFHAFYTGCAGTNGGYQTICHAVSHDLTTWEKDRRNPILLPQAPFATSEQAAWRDPSVVLEADGTYRMILSAELPDRPEILKGCLAEFRSANLIDWQFHSIFYAPMEAQKMECPDLFRMEHDWLLLYSDFGVQIRRRQTDHEPWMKTVPAKLDDFRFYAAKTLLDGNKRRICFGFVNGRVEQMDTSPWNWGGVLSLPRHIREDESGEFQMLPVEELETLKDKPLSFNETQDSFSHGDIQVVEDSLICSVPKGETALLGLGQHPDLWWLDFSLLDTGRERTSLLFNCEKDLKSGYRLQFDPRYHRISLARLNPQHIGDSLVLQSMNVPAALWHDPKVTVIFDRTVIEVFFNQKISFSCRVYELMPTCNWWGFLSNDGHIRLKNVSAWELKPRIETP